MQIGDIILVSGNSIISKVIQKITRSKWTHTAIYIGNGYTLEIDWNTRAEISKKDYRKLEFDYAILRSNKRLTVDQTRQIVYSSIKHNQMGSRYDFFLLFSMLLNSLFPNGKLFRKLNRKNAYICTELIDSIMKDAGIDLFPNKKGDIFPYEFLGSQYLYPVSLKEK